MNKLLDTIIVAPNLEENSKKEYVRYLKHFNEICETDIGSFDLLFDPDNSVKKLNS